MAEIHNQSFRIIRSQRNAEKLVEGGYMYGKQRRIGETTHWLCEQRGLCRAILHTNGNEIVKRTNEHSHTSDNTAVSCREVKANLKRKAKDTQESSHYIVSDSLQTNTEGAAAKLPKLDSLKRTIQRQRVHHNIVMVQPTSLEQLFLPEEYKLTSKGEPFLLYDSGPETQDFNFRNSEEPRDATVI